MADSSAVFFSGRSQVVMHKHPLQRSLNVYAQNQLLSQFPVAISKAREITDSSQALCHHAWNQEDSSFWLPVRPN